MLARIAEVEQLVSQAQIRQEETLQSLRTQKIENEERADRQMKKLGLIKQKLATQETENSNTLGVARDALQGITEVQNLLVQVSQNVINLQVTASNSTFLRPLDPTRGAPVVLEDSLGRRFEIPAQWIDSLEWHVSMFSNPLNEGILVFV